MLRSAPAAAVVVAGMLASAPALAGETTLYNLGQHSNDGNFPSSTVAADKVGNLFGVTIYGGSTGHGAVYQVLAGSPRTEQLVHDFAGGADGANPASDLILDAQGNVYGTTSGGGSGGGTVFELMRPASGTAWTKQVLHNFAGSDGADPVGRLWRDKLGALYGATFVGGGVYKLTPNSATPPAYTYSLLHSFSGATEGFGPYAGVVADVAGNLYGTTSAGGTAGGGTVYRLNRPAKASGTWTLTVLHPFGAGQDGKGPAAGLLIDAAGTLYGTTASGGTAGKGTVFRLSPPMSAGAGWGYGVILNFTGPNGASPANSGLVADAGGNLYGTTSGGGSTNAFGAVFELSPSGGGWTASVPFSFTGDTRGAFPGHGLMVDAKGRLFGTAMGGRYGGGVVFEVTH